MSGSYIAAHMRYMAGLIAVKGGTMEAFERVVQMFDLNDLERARLAKDAGLTKPLPAAPVRVIKSYARIGT